MDEGAKRGEATIHSFSAADLLGAVGSGSTAQEGGTFVIEFGIVSFSLIKGQSKTFIFVGVVEQADPNFAMNILSLTTITICNKKQNESQ